LNSLRTSTKETNCLAQALKRATENCSIPRSMALNFVVVGDARETRPIVRDEIYRIGYEAILNACVHSSASKLEIELTYGETSRYVWRTTVQEFTPRSQIRDSKGTSGYKECANARPA
jgi:signal transduction histidine kinase